MLRLGALFHRNSCSCGLSMEDVFSQTQDESQSNTEGALTCNLRLALATSKIQHYDPAF